MKKQELNHFYRSLDLEYYLHKYFIFSYMIVTSENAINIPFVAWDTTSVSIQSQGNILFTNNAKNNRTVIHYMINILIKTIYCIFDPNYILLKNEEKNYTNFFIQHLKGN